MKDKRKTIIQPETISEAEEIFEYIKTNSPQNAEKFRQEFLKSVEKVEDNPDAKKRLSQKKIVTFGDIYAMAYIFRKSV